MLQDVIYTIPQEFAFNAKVMLQAHKTVQHAQITVLTAQPLLIPQETPHVLHAMEDSIFGQQTIHV